MLQDKEIEQVGGAKTLSVDIRIIAATNRNLPAMVKKGGFREDLWFRLNVFPITIPPLRHRTVDIPSLVRYFVERKAIQLRLQAIPPLAPGALDRLMAYHWPGNIRELENVIERALILDPNGPLTFDMLVTPGEDPQSSSIQTVKFDESMTLDEAMAAHIQTVFDRVGGRIHGEGGAAQVLGINPSTLRSKMNKLGITYGRSKKG